MFERRPAATSRLDKSSTMKRPSRRRLAASRTSGGVVEARDGIYDSDWVTEIARRRSTLTGSTSSGANLKLRPIAASSRVRYRKAPRQGVARRAHSPAARSPRDIVQAPSTPGARAIKVVILFSRSTTQRRLGAAGRRSSGRRPTGRPADYDKRRRIRRSSTSAPARKARGIGRRGGTGGKGRNSIGRARSTRRWRRAMKDLNPGTSAAVKSAFGGKSSRSCTPAGRRSERSSASRRSPAPTSRSSPATTRRAGGRQRAGISGRARVSSTPPSRAISHADRQAAKSSTYRTWDVSVQGAGEETKTRTDPAQWPARACTNCMARRTP